MFPCGLSYTAPRLYAPHWTHADICIVINEQGLNQIEPEPSGQNWVLNKLFKNLGVIC